MAAAGPDNRRVVLVREPRGLPRPDDFDVQPVAVPTGAGVLADVCYISLDPYLRGRLSGRHISGPIGVGETMDSELVVRLAEDSATLPAGALARAFGPWQERVRLPAESLTAVPAHLDPPSLALGVLGMPGLTAYAGVTRMLRPNAGETVVVSAAAGPVGATVGQLCKSAGARVVGIAGSDAKREWLYGTAGFDACIDRREPVRDGLDACCPDGVDMYFDNVGGDILQAVMERLAPQARVVLCGLMDQYNRAVAPPGPNPALVIRARATVFGLVVYDHEALRGAMEADLGARIRGGALAFREDVADGLDQAPAAFCRLMGGGTFGKAIVRVG